MSTRRARVTIGIGITGILMAAGCGISQSKYDTTANRLKRTERDLDQSREAHNATKQKLTAAEMQIKGIRGHLQTVQRKLRASQARLATLETKLRASKTPPAAPARAVAPPPRPAAGGASVKGGLDLAAVQVGVDKIKGRIRECYEKRVLKKGKKLKGFLISKFRIDKRGKPRRVKVRRGTIKHRRLQKCVRRAIRKARFARSKKKSKVVYPLNFAP